MVELPLRLIRKGDKVRILVARGFVKKGDNHLWWVKEMQKTGGWLPWFCSLLQVKRRNS